MPDKIPTIITSAAATWLLSRCPDTHFAIYWSSRVASGELVASIGDDGVRIVDVATG